MEERQTEDLENEPPTHHLRNLTRLKFLKQVVLQHLLTMWKSTGSQQPTESFWEHQKQVGGMKRQEQTLRIKSATRCSLNSNESRE
jgi:hypothetical protein